MMHSALAGNLRDCSQRTPTSPTSDPKIQQSEHKNQNVCKGLHRYFCIHNKRHRRLLSEFLQFHFGKFSLGNFHSNFEPLVSLLLSNTVDKKEEGSTQKEAIERSELN